MVDTEVHPLASVTVYSFMPALAVNVPVPEYGSVPPVAVTVTVVVPPKQVMVPASAVASSAEVMEETELDDTETSHPLASVTTK